MGDRTATRPTHALAPLESLVPIAVSVTPFEVCQVTRVTPAAAAAAPETDIVDAATWATAGAIMRKPNARIFLKAGNFELDPARVETHHHPAKSA